MKEQVLFLNPGKNNIREIVKDIEMGKKDYWMSSITQPGLFGPFIIFGLFYKN